CSDCDSVLTRREKIARRFYGTTCALLGRLDCAFPGADFSSASAWRDLILSSHGAARNSDVSGRAAPGSIAAPGSHSVGPAQGMAQRARAMDETPARSACLACFDPAAVSVVDSCRGNLALARAAILS